MVVSTQSGNRHSHPAASTKRSHSTHNLATSSSSTGHRVNTQGFALTPMLDNNPGNRDGGSNASTSVTSNGTATMPSNKRRQSSDDPSGHAHHTSHTHTARLGPKRKSRVGISGMTSTTAMTAGAGGSAAALHRKTNASSSALAGHGPNRKEKSRSHASLANLANEIAMAYEQGQQDASGKDGQAHGKTTKSKSQMKEVPVRKSTDEEEGWVSASSSKTGTPELRNSPPSNQLATSPSSFKPLEFGKKVRRKPLHQVQSQLQLERPPMDRDDSENTKESQSTGTTPKQESVLQQKAQQGQYLQAPVREGEDDEITPTREVKESEALQGPPTPRLSQNQESSQQEISLADDAKTVPSQSSSTQTSPQRSKKASNHVGYGEASTSGQVSRPHPLRKPSTSTIRSNLSLTGLHRPPLSPALRRQTAPLEPRLDTSVEGFGEIPEQATITSPPGQVPFPSASSPAMSSSVPRMSVHHRQTSSSSLNPAKSSSRAGTLTPQEAEDLAKRLRTVSGGDLSTSRGLLKRSLSTVSTASLAGMESQGSHHRQDSSGSLAGSSAGTGAMNTLKRASGYFGSIGKLAALSSTLGLTSATTSPTTTQHPSTGTPTTPSSADKKPASPLTSATVTSQGLSTSPSQQRLATAAGPRRSYAPPPSASSTYQNYARPPLVSKFIDPSESYTPFPKATTTSQSPSTHIQKEHKSSRASQKLMTQRDAPHYSDSEGEDGEGKSGAATPLGYKSDEDGGPSSQLNIRSTMSSDQLNKVKKQQQQQPLQPGVQRWIIALVKEAERIDKEHDTVKRFHNSVQASMARILERKQLAEEEERREERQREYEKARGSRPSSLRNKTPR